MVGDEFRDDERADRAHDRKKSLLANVGKDAVALADGFDGRSGKHHDQAHQHKQKRGDHQEHTRHHDVGRYATRIRLATHPIGLVVPFFTMHVQPRQRLLDPYCACWARKSTSCLKTRPRCSKESNSSNDAHAGESTIDMPGWAKAIALSSASSI